MKTIYIDYDSTLVNFGEVYLAKVNKHYGLNLDLNQLEDFIKETKIDKEKSKELMELYSVGNIYKDIKVFDGAIDFLKNLKSKGYIIKIITSSASGDQKKYKTLHINKYLENLFDEIVYSNKKEIHTKNNLFIDDSLKHILKHVENIKDNNNNGILCNFENKKITEEQLNVINNNNKNNNNKIIFVNNFKDLETAVYSCEKKQEINYQSPSLF